MKKIQPQQVYIVFCAVFIGAALILSGCAKPPTEEMAAALEALTRAENDPGALGYAEIVLQEARASLEEMYEEANSKRYDSAKVLSGVVIALAEKAIADGKAGADRAKDEAGRSVADVKAEVEKAAQALDAALKNTGLVLDRALLQDELLFARSLAGDAEAKLAGGEYGEAQETAGEAKLFAARILAALAEGARAASRKM